MKDFKAPNTLWAVLISSHTTTEKHMDIYICVCVYICVYYLYMIFGIVLLWLYRTQIMAIAITTATTPRLSTAIWTLG